MKKIIVNIKIFDLFLVILSGVLTQLAITKQLYVLAWICFTPYFLILLPSNNKQSFFYGLLFGICIAIPSFFWMISGSEKFTGNSIFYGIIVFFLSGLLLSLYFGLISFIYKLFELKLKGKNYSLLNCIILASTFTLGEFLFSFLLAEMPWFGFHSGMALTSNLYFIQPASFSGVAVLSFFVLVENALLAVIFLNKKPKQLWIPVTVLFLYFLWGFLEFNYQKSRISDNKPFTVALVNNNIDPEIKWNDSTGNFLVSQLFQLNKQAAALHPDLVVWTESAVPWTYRSDDDFLAEIIKIYQNESATQLIGLNTDFDRNIIYNSVYCLLPDGKVEGRYDKRFLLAMIEATKAGIIFPFLSSNGFEVQKGESMEPLHTPFGNAGIMICNESTIPSAANDMVRNGADFLVNISNDGWFSHSYLVDLHFYNARLRAVENRKPLIVNSNRGYSGAFAATGEILMKKKSNEPLVETIKIFPNDYFSLSYWSPYTFMVISMLILLTTTYFKIKK